MRTLAEFFRDVYVSQCLWDRDNRTLNEYQSTIRLVDDVLDRPIPGTLGFSRDAFIRELKKRKLASATINKHIRHINAVLKQMGIGTKWASIDVDDSEPKQVSDVEFQGL